MQKQLQWLKKCITLVAVIGCCLSAALSAPSIAAPASLVPMITPPAPKIDARGYVLMDANSGKILAEKNMHKSMPPASLTKLMTLYVASQAIAKGQIHLDDKVRVSKNAWKRGGSRMFLKLGSYVTVKDLIDGIIVASGNDACVTLAEYIAGNEQSFAALMNASAAHLGMKDSHYVDSTGLPKPGHHSSPYDIAILTRHIINDFPQDYIWYKQKWITYNHIKQPNRNRLLWRDTSVDGLKTGHTKSAGYCLVASAKRDDMRLISVVMGAPSDSDRATDSQILLNWGFRFFKTHHLFNALKPLATPRVWLGQSRNVNLGLQKDLVVTIANGSYPQLKASIQIDPKIKAPVIKDHPYGQVIITLSGKVIKTEPLVALQSDQRGGLWTRFTDHIALFFHGWFS